MRKVLLLLVILLALPVFGADEYLRRDGYHNPVGGAITDDVNKEIRMLKVDPTTGRLRVDSISVGATDTTASGTITALNGVVSTAVTGQQGAAVLLTGTWVGTVVPEISVDGGTTYVATSFITFPNLTLSSSTTGNATLGILVVNGASHVRVKASAYTSGTITVALRSTGLLTFFNPYQATSGGAIPTLGVMIGGSDGTNLQFLRSSNANPGGTEYALITRNIPSGSQTVAQATAANLNATVVQGTAANLNATVVQGTAANLNATVVQGTAANLNATVVGSGTFTTQEAGSSSLIDGTASVTTTPTVLATNTIREVVIQADPDNTDAIFVGNSGSQSIQLNPGASIVITCTNTNLIYHKSASGTQTLNFLGRP